MQSSGESGGVARFDVENIGGIGRTTVSISPGVTVLTGENATNRTSFLQAVIAAMGSTAATLKGDADEGSVRLNLDGETYERRLERAGDDTRYTGEGYLDDATVAELFAFLLERNEARQSVAAGGDLRELIMRPVDTAAIAADVERLEAEKAQLTEQLSALEERKQELADLKARRDDLSEQIAAKRAALAEKEAEIDETDVERHRRDRAEFEQTLTELRETRSELETVRRDIEAQSESVASLRREQSELETERDELSAAPDGDHERLDREIRELRARRQSLNTALSDLQGVIEYNEERLAGDVTEIRELSGETDGGTGEGLLRAEAGVVCWTCGSTVEREQIESTVARLRDLREEKLAELESVKSALAERKAERRELEATSRRRREIAADLEDVESERARREERLEQLNRRRSALTETVERLEETVQSLESAEFEHVLALHREANQLEFELDRLASEREAVVADIEELAATLGRAETLRERRAEVVDALTDTRRRIDRLERDAVEAFNEHMAAALDILEYDNVERIWIERLQAEDDDRAAFDLHVVRTTATGAVYEDSVSHLSESEREVTGLVFALAGYLVHELHETVPFVLLDSLEAIDAERIAALVDYLADHVDYLVVALLPEDARALDDSYARIRSL
ncbi:archaea-specific SMC-related protein [Haloarcula onubensis]|uniref:AAA family ATPase n=1 Tax=Haloarcula onubensis TaxID=2950539 RepID=A0ABU2FM44_9EURY|nr:archaea-specific SMC-related protein [Halomicroarcula sp. S3CR25-11]MDS0281479.1 AAA family ATPase [Halomicroarcula sp. S3CR25-11]